MEGEMMNGEMKTAGPEVKKDEDGVPLRLRSIWLSDRDWAEARRLGQGKAARGIRAALRCAETACPEQGAA